MVPDSLQFQYSRPWMATLPEKAAPAQASGNFVKFN